MQCLEGVLWPRLARDAEKLNSSKALRTWHPTKYDSGLANDRLQNFVARGEGLLTISSNDCLGHILLKNSKPSFSRVCRNLPGDEIVEYGAVVNVELFSPTSLFANKRVFQQNWHRAASQANE